MLLRILFVCTGNICRSPIAEGLLVDRLKGLSGDPVEVRSAGTWGRKGSPATGDAVAAAARLGIDIDAHRSSRFTARLAHEVDLIITMTSDQAEEVLEEVPAAAAKTFIFKELVALLGSLPPATGGDPSRESLLRRIADADEARSAGFRPPTDLDVADPLGLSSVAYSAVAAELEGLVDDLLRGLLGGRESAAASG